MSQRLRSIQEWRVQQGVKLRDWRKACLPGTVLMLVLALAGMALLALVTLSDPLMIAIGGMVALLPLALTVYWLIPIPQIWDVHPSIVAITSFLASVLLVLFGQYFAGHLLNRIFHDTPSVFPVAHAVATYLGALLGAVALITSVALILLITLAGWALSSAVLRWSGPRRLFRDLSVYAVLALLAGFTLGSLDHLERLAARATTWVAIEADFFADHRCETQGWPEGVTRVAFIGDEQVLAYVETRRWLVVLPCQRIVFPN